MRYSGPQPLQLLVHRLGSGKSELDVVENPSGHRPPWFDAHSSSSRVPRVGTTDILRIARALAARDFHIARFEFADARFGKLNDDEADEYSPILRSLLIESGVASANAYLMENAPELVLTGVALHAPDGTRSTLRRNGILIAQTESATTEALREIWPAVAGW